MAGVFRALKLPQKVRKDKILSNTDAGDDIPGLHRKIGNVTYRIVPRRDEPIRFVLKKEVAPAVAERLAELGPVNTLFTLEVFENALIIPSFADAASLEEILNVRAGWPFHPEHSQVLAADILAGISSLRSVGLQRNGFSVSDILLVGRNNTYFFQIGKLPGALWILLTREAGIENCTCISGHEPINSQELELHSLIDVLKYVGETLKPPRFPWIDNFVRYLETKRTLDRTWLEEATRRLPPSVDQLHRELEIYIHAVRILGTTMGGSSIGDAR